MAARPRAVAMKVLPTPTGPMTTTLWAASTKRSEHSSSHIAWSYVMAGESSQRPRRMEGSSPAERAPRAAGALSRGHLVGEHQLEELAMAEGAGPGQGDLFGQGVEAAAE